MPTPSEMRADAERLRELASIMDGQAGEANGLMSGVAQALVTDSVKAGVTARIWSGPAPDALEERIRTWIRDSSDAAGQLQEYAHPCRIHADRLDDEATETEDEVTVRRDADGPPVPGSGGD